MQEKSYIFYMKHYWVNVWHLYYNFWFCKKQQISNLLESTRFYGNLVPRGPCLKTAYRFVSQSVRVITWRRRSRGAATREGVTRGDELVEVAVEFRRFHRVIYSRVAFISTASTGPRFTLAPRRTGRNVTSRWPWNRYNSKPPSRYVSRYLLETVITPRPPDEWCSLRAWIMHKWSHLLASINH